MNKTITKKAYIILIGVMIAMSLFGCGEKKYKLILDEYGFESKKTEYAEGESVTIYYDMIATDTDYSFYTEPDDVDLKQNYDNAHGYVFEFTMPAHDVKMCVSSRNTMEYDPDANGGYEPDGTDDGEIHDGQDDGRAPEGGWVCPECGYDKNEGKFCANCGSKKPGE